MTELSVEKNLLTEEDVAWGDGPTLQQRQGTPFSLKKVRTIKPVYSVEELNALDTAKFTKAALFVGDAVTFFSWSGSAWVEVDPGGALAALSAFISDLADIEDFSKGSALVGRAVNTFSTVAEMLSAPLEVGSRVAWLGYYSALDGGGNSGVVKSGTHTNDGGSVFSVDASTYVEADHTGDVILASRFGCNGSSDLAKLQAAIDYADGRVVDVSSCANLSGTISGASKISLKGSKSGKITLSGLLTFDNTNADITFEDVHFDATNVPNGTSTAVYVQCSGHFECINSDCQNAPRGNMLVSKCNTVVGWGGDFSNSGQENYVSGGVNIGVGLHLYGIVTRGRWYNPIANDCWQIGVFINGTGTDICNDTVVYNVTVNDAMDNGVRTQPEDAAYLGVQDCGFVNPIVSGSAIDNIRINGTRCFCLGGRTSNAAGWGCKTDGGTDIEMTGLTARGNGSGIGGRITVDLDGLLIKNNDSDNPSGSPAIYVVQVTSGKTVHNVKAVGNTTEGGAQADLAIILVNKADGEKIVARGNTYTGAATGSYREVFGLIDGVKSIDNAAPEGGGTRAFINLSGCDNATVLDFNGVDAAAGTLWGIEANNGTTTSQVAKSAFIGISSTPIGGSASGGVTDAGGNIT